jgi:hypothetical protein
MEKEMRKYSILVMEMRCILVKPHHADGCNFEKQLAKGIDVKFEFDFTPIFFHSSIVVQKSFVFIENVKFTPVHFDGFLYFCDKLWKKATSFDETLAIYSIPQIISD